MGPEELPEEQLEQFLAFLDGEGTAPLFSSLLTRESLLSDPGDVLQLFLRLFK